MLSAIQHHHMLQLLALVNSITMQARENGNLTIC